jgi:hypothetical protein
MISVVREKQVLANSKITIEMERENSYLINYKSQKALCTWHIKNLNRKLN